MREWKERARSARQALGSAKHGEREAILSGIGGGVNVNTVRRQIKALAFFDLLQLEAPAVGAQLQDSSFNSIELLARWHDFDSAAAFDAARKLAAGEYSWGSLQLAMKSARERLQALPVKDLHARIRLSVKKQIQRLFGQPLKVIELPQPNRPPIDFLFTTRSPDGIERVAAWIVGPYANPETYSKRRNDELLRAMGIAWLFDHVVLVLPSAGKLPEYQANLNELLQVSRGTERPSVHVIQLKNF